MNRSRSFKYLTLLLALFLFSCFSISVGATVPAEQKPVEATVDLKQEMIERWGVEVLSLRLTSARYMLDFRYKVHDAKKAKTLFVRQSKPILIDQETGAKFIVPTPPKIGPLRNSNTPKEGRNYAIIFANPGRYVKAGKKVTVEIGDFVVKNLIVE